MLRFSVSRFLRRHAPELRSMHRFSVLWLFPIFHCVSYMPLSCVACIVSLLPVFLRRHAPELCSMYRFSVLWLFSTFHCVSYMPLSCVACIVSLLYGCFLFFSVFSTKICPWSISSICCVRPIRTFFIAPVGSTGMMLSCTCPTLASSCNLLSFLYLPSIFLPISSLSIDSYVRSR